MTASTVSNSARTPATKRSNISRVRSRTAGFSSYTAYSSKRIQKDSGSPRQVSMAWSTAAVMRSSGSATPAPRLPFLGEPAVELLDDGEHSSLDGK